LSSKYSDLTPDDVRQFINNGTYTVETIDLVRDNGTIVRHLEPTESLPLPSSVLSYNIYNQTIQEVNLDRVFDAIANERDKAISESLDIQYNVVLDNLAYYKDHGKRLDLLNSKSLDAISSFEFGSMRGLSSLENFWEKPDTTILTVDSYSNVLFVYIMSGYWLHGHQFGVDTTSRTRLAKLERTVQKIYEQLLIECDDKVDKYSLGRSVYAYVYLARDINTKIIHDLVLHDSRCDTPLDFFESFSEHCVEEEWRNGGATFKTYTENHFRTNVDGRLKYATKLHDILTKIQNIKGVMSQLCAAGEIDESRIQLGDGFVRSPLSIIRIGNDNQNQKADS